MRTVLLVLSISASYTVLLAQKLDLVLQAGLAEPAAALAFSPNGQYVAACGRTGSVVKIFKTATGSLLRDLDTGLGGRTLSAPALQFSADSTQLQGYVQGTYHQWDVQTGRSLKQAPLVRIDDGKGWRTTPMFQLDMGAARFSTDGRILAETDDRGRHRLWDVQTLKTLSAKGYPTNKLGDLSRALALSPDGKRIAIGDTGLGISTFLHGAFGVTGAKKLRSFGKVKDVETGKQLYELKVEASSSERLTAVYQALKFSPDNRYLATMYASLYSSHQHHDPGAVLAVWESGSGRLLATFEIPEFRTEGFAATASLENAFAFTPDSSRIYAVTGSTDVRIFDLAARRAVAPLALGAGVVQVLALSSNGEILATSDVQDQVRLWDVTQVAEGARLLRNLGGPTLPIWAARFSSDGRKLISLARNSVSTWDFANGLMSGSKEYVRAGDGPWNVDPGFRMLSRNGSITVIATDERVNGWDTETGRLLWGSSLELDHRLVRAFFTSDSKFLVTVDLLVDLAAVPQGGPSTAAGAPPPRLGSLAGAIAGAVLRGAAAGATRQDPQEPASEDGKQPDPPKKKGGIWGQVLLGAAGVKKPSINVNTDQTAPAEDPDAPEPPPEPQPEFRIRLLDARTGRPVRMLAEGNPYAFTALSPDALWAVREDCVLQAVDDPNQNAVLEIPCAGWNAPVFSADGKRLAVVATPQYLRSYLLVWDISNRMSPRPLVQRQVSHVSTPVFSPDGRHVVLPQANRLLLVDTNSGKESQLQGHQLRIEDAAFRPDGKLLATASHDGTMRLWDIEGGGQLATLMSWKQSRDWLVLTPDGLLDGTPRAWSEISWRFSEKASDVAPAEWYFADFFRPGVLAELTEGKRPQAPREIASRDRRQPVVQIESAADGASGEGKIRITVREPGGAEEKPAGARDLRLFRDGVLVKSWRGDLLKGAPAAVFDATVPLVAGPNEFAAYAFNQDNVKSLDGRMTLASKMRPWTGTAYVLAIGVNDYANPGMNLRYAVPDAKLFGEEVGYRLKKLPQFAEVKVVTLLDQEATRENIRIALERLSKSAPLPDRAPGQLENILPARAEDAVFIYFAGHGQTAGDRFYMIPRDVGLAARDSGLTEQVVRANSVSDEDLGELLEGVNAGRLVLVIDACRSGQMLESEERRRGPMNSKGLAQLAWEKGMYVLTAAQSYQAALEAAALGHGYLTYALIEEGVKKGAADHAPKDGAIQLREWFDFASARVLQMQEEELKNRVFAKEEKIGDARSTQQPRLFYRREVDPVPFVVARP